MAGGRGQNVLGPIDLFNDFAFYFKMKCKSTKKI